MKTKLIFLLLMTLLCGTALALQNNPTLSKVDRLRLAEAFRLNKFIGDKIWKDWSKIPFAVLLVTPEYEFLIRHPKPSKDFVLVGYDPLLESNVYFRKRVFQANLLATFPAVGGVSTIVVGQAENTDSKTSVPWVLTLMHEHFHQLQDSQFGIYQEIDALNLSRGDQTGIWMLNYAFPYKSTEINQKFTVLSKALGTALRSKNKKDFSQNLSVYLSARKDFQQTLNSDDYKYFSFQLWKEGIARYTEYRVAALAKKYKASKEFRNLKDYTIFDQSLQKIKENVLENLDSPHLEDYQRVSFYPFGAGEGMLLDKANSQWNERYFTEKFYLEKYFEER